MHDLGLGAARAVDHTVYARAHLVEQPFDDGGIGAGGREYQFAGVDTQFGNLVGQFQLSRIDQFVGYGIVVALGIFGGEVFGKYVVTGRGEPVAAHTAVVLFFIRGFAVGRESHDDVAGADMFVRYDIFPFHAAGHGAVDDDGSHQVAHVGRFAARTVSVHTQGAQFGQQLFGAVDDGRDNLARNQQFVAADGRRHEYVVGSSHAEQVVDVHDEGILCNTSPHAQVARLAPVHVGQRRFGPGSVGMHDVAIFGVAAQDVGDNFAEGFGEDTLVDIFDGVVHIFFRCRHAAQVVTLVAHRCVV